MNQVTKAALEYDAYKKLQNEGPGTYELRGRDGVVRTVTVTDKSLSGINGPMPDTVIEGDDD